jgi:hypothetical protein
VSESPISDEDVNRVMREGAALQLRARSFAAKMKCCGAYAGGYLTAMMLGMVTSAARWVVPGIVIGWAVLVVLMRDSGRKGGEP